MLPSREQLIRELKLLSEHAWEGRATTPSIETWLENFSGEVIDQTDEQLHALYMLSQFNYFGVRELRTLLISMYRDIYRYDLVQEIRQRNNNSKDASLVKREFDKALSRTRFIAMGNPSESGAHIMYYFRQVNTLRKDLFVSSHELASDRLSSPAAKLNPDDLERVVFIDDMLGSGTQAEEYSAPVIADLRELAQRTGKSLKISYLVLFAKSEGLQHLRSTDFDEVRAVHELDASQAIFDTESRLYAKDSRGFSMEEARKIAEHYGRKLLPDHPLGYKNGQLILGLPHNVPDNTLPIFWYQHTQGTWKPIFPRFEKVY